jgi:hypothetical protein
MTLSILGSFIFWMIACFFYACISVQRFRFDISIFAGKSWFDPDLSYKRKYKYMSNYGGVVTLKKAPNSWYYRMFRLKYEERFLGSATIFAFITDAFHLGQMLMNLALIGAVTSFAYRIPTLTQFLWIVVVFKISWSAFHEYCFAHLLIKKGPK